MERTTVTIEGMTCDHCVRAVTGALRGLDGVVVERVEIGSATLAYDPAVLSGERLTQAIEEEGYAVAGVERL